MFSMPICARTGAAGPMSDSRSRAPAPVCRAGRRGGMMVRSRIPRIPIDCPPSGDSVTVFRLRIRDHRRCSRQSGRPSVMSGSTPVHRGLSLGQYGLGENGHSPLIPRAVMLGMGTAGRDGEGVTALYGGRSIPVRLTFRLPVGGKRGILTALVSGWEGTTAVARPGRGRWHRCGGIALPAGRPVSAGNPGKVTPDRQVRVNRAIHILDHSALFRVPARSAARAGRVPRTRRWIGERTAAIRDGVDVRRTGCGK